jgi:hypothetical protein
MAASVERKTIHIRVRGAACVYNLRHEPRRLTRPAVLAAIEEHDRLGREEFLRNYGFGPAQDYRLLFNGREYDSKAIAGVAHRFTAPRAQPLTAADFSGGRSTVKRTLERLGFVVNDSARATDAPDLEPAPSASSPPVGGNPTCFSWRGGARAH